MTNQRGEGASPGRGQGRDTESDEDQRQPQGTAATSPGVTGDPVIDGQIRGRSNARRRAREELQKQLNFDGTARDENLRIQLDRLMHTPLKDPRSPDINYGHRKWPVAMPAVDDFIHDLMKDIWMVGINSDWRTDTLHASRCRTLIDEFQRTGLPQTIHCDLNDELDIRPGSAEARNCAYRCPCWEKALGENWFNHSDATLIQTIGNGWGMQNQHLLIHLLRRLLLAMTCTYIRDAPECIITNRPRGNKYAKRRKHNWWPTECQLIYEKIREIKGSDPSERTGLNMKIQTEGYFLITHMTGLPYREVCMRLEREQRRERTCLRAQAAAEGGTEAGEAADVGTAGGPAAGTIEMGPPRDPPVRSFGGYLTIEERRFWESYLLEERTLDPRFTAGRINEEKRKEFLEEVALPEHVQDAEVFKRKVKYLIDTYLYAKDQRHNRGRRHEAEAIVAYNTIAVENGALPYDSVNIENNNKEWCRMAARFVTHVNRNLDVRLQTGEMAPTNYDAREQATLFAAQDAFEETVQMNIAIERSLEQQQQQHPVAFDPQSELEQEILEKVLQDSQQTLGTQYGRMYEAAFTIRDPDVLALELQQRQQAEAREKRKEPTKSPPAKKKKKKKGPSGPGGSSRPANVPRSPSPPRQPENVEPENVDLFTVEDFEDPTQQPEPADLDLFMADDFLRSMEKEPLDESVRRRLFVGPQSVAGLTGDLFDQVINADDELRSSPDIQSYLDLVHGALSPHRQGQMGNSPDSQTYLDLVNDAIDELPIDPQRKKQTGNSPDSQTYLDLVNDAINSQQRQEQTGNSPDSQTYLDLVNDATNSPLRQEQTRISPDSRTYLDLVNDVLSPERQGQVPGYEVRGLEVEGEEDWIDITRKSIYATIEQFRRSQSPERGFEIPGGGEGSPGGEMQPGWSPGQLIRRSPGSPGGGPGGGDPGGGGGGGGGPGWPERGNNDDDEDINILNFVDMYESVALDHPDVLVYIRWPSKLEQFNFWVIEKWPDFYTCVRWPRCIFYEPPEPNLVDEF